MGDASWVTMDVAERGVGVAVDGGEVAVGLGSAVPVGVSLGVGIAVGVVVVVGVSVGLAVGGSVPTGVGVALDPLMRFI